MLLYPSSTVIIIHHIQIDNDEEAEESSASKIDEEMEGRRLEDNLRLLISWDDQSK